MSTRRAGEWPATDPVDLEQADEHGELHLKLAAEQASFHVPLGAIRAHLEAQPSARCVRTAARRWIDAITQLADEVGRQPRDTG